MIALPLLLAVLSGQACTAVTTPRVKTVYVIGDSRMQGGLCSASSPASPPGYMDANLQGGADYGWLVKNAGSTGTTTAQQRAIYENATTGESKACNGERCAHFVIGGAVNCLRAGSLASTCFADHVWMVDDALSKGVAVVWFEETDYSLWASAGANPGTQVAAYNTAWSAACAARASNKLLKCMSNYVESGVPLANTCDGVHLNQTGTNSLGARLLTALQSIP
jgi:hypothetical protein